MNSNKIKQHYAIMIFFVVFLGILIYKFPSHAVASEDIFLKVSPAVMLVELAEPGSEKKVSFTLTNASEHTETVSLQFFPLEKIDKKTNRLIYQSNSALSEAQQSFYQNAISIIVDGRPASEITLPPLQTREVEAVITYNTGQSPSEYYTTLGFISDSSESIEETGENETKAKITVNGGVGSHILVSLGERKSEVTIDSIKPVSYSSNTPDVLLRLTNQTDKTTKLYGNISIFNFLGMKIASIDTTDIYLLGNESKAVSLKNDKFSSNRLIQALSIGPTTLKATLQNTSGNKQLSSEETYVYFPIKTVVIIIAFLLAAVIIARKIKRRVA